MLTYLETYSQERVSVTTTSLGSVMSSSNLLSVWHCVSDSFRCCTDELKQSNIHDFSLTLFWQYKNHKMLCILRVFVYPHVCCGRVEELADDVGGGCDAEDDGAQNLFPPRQQQYRIFPSHLWPLSIFLQQNTHCRLITPVTVTRTVWKVVSIIYMGKQRRRWWVQIHCLSNHVHSQTKCWNGLKDCCSYHTGTAVLTELHYCTPHERIYHYSDIYQTPQSPPGLEYGKGSLGGNGHVLLTTKHSFFVCMRCINILTDKGFPFDRRWWHHVTVTAPPVQSFGLRWKLLRDSHRGLEVQLTLEHSFNEREIIF